MAAVNYGNFITAEHLKDLGYCMIAIATTFTVIRFGIRAVKRRFWLIEDCVVVLAWACFIALCAGYIKVTDTVYRIAAVGTGKMAPYPTLDKDVHFLLVVFFPNTLLLWCCLWLVKWSLLLNCRRLVERQPGYTVVWWCIVAFCVVSFIGCIITEFTSCRSLHAWFTPGLCQSERDAKASIISLLFSYGMDMLTDLMIMVFPLRVLWNLRLSPLRKLGIMSVFGVGILCMVTSTIRVAQIRAKSGTKQPSPSWLEVWAMVETGIAVTVACLPTFGLLMASSKPSRPETSDNGVNSPRKASNSSSPTRNGIPLHDRSTGLARPVVKGNASSSHLHTLSQDSVIVTTTVDYYVQASPIQKVGGFFGPKEPYSPLK